VTPQLSFNGIEYEGATFTYVSDNPCVTVEGETLTAALEGNAKISISASYRGIENIATGDFICTVNSSNGLVPNRSRYNLFIAESVGGQSFETKVDLSVDAYIGGVVEKDVDVVWTVADATVAALVGNKLTAKKIGMTTVTGVYEKNGKTLRTIPIPVTVSPSIITTQKSVTIDKSTTIASFDSYNICGEDVLLGSMIVNGVSYNLEGNAVESENFKTGEYDATFYSEDGTFGASVNLVVADFVVGTVEDFQNITDFADGYIALSQSISVGAYKAKNKEKIFTGVFNGLGNTISDIKLTESLAGFFGDAKNATFKNLSIKNATIEKGAGIGIFCYRSTGTNTVDNVYLEVNYGTNACSESGGVMGILFGGMLKIKNSIIVVTYPMPIDNSGAVVGRSNGCSLVMENSYVITNGTICGMKVHVNNQNYAQLNSLSCVYPTAEEFAEKRYADNSPIDLSSFADFWDLNKPVPSF
jgi:hypothetical protein